MENVNTMAKKNYIELPAEQRKSMIEQRLIQYKQQIFSLQMDRAALESVEDCEGIKSIDQRIEAIRKAYSAVERMM
ncbi:hypothetical protein [Paenibacillus sp. XY044]|uniref:hypothetical protein n=1 Tax=Paenibacillus sp. XY044 TaxID=2026089 RepID=UPI000B97E037|nr:hypothetical protein [Paenibacillus sp. XY044]OZB90057.1 hypothetical protein CJP46_35350 [Paenibacillus sp. XY044]